MQVIINVGHSPYKDKGAVSADKKYTEYGLNAVFSLALEREMLKLGIYSTLINQGHEGFGRLAQKCNAVTADCVVSLHLNAFSETSSGTETLYWHSSQRSKELAQEVQGRMVGALGLPDRGIKAKRNGDRGAALLRDTDSPCVLLEPAFISNPQDLATWLKRQDELATAIAAGLLAWHCPA